jgi:hypothetical protein
LEGMLIGQAIAKGWARYVKGEGGLEVYAND